MNRRVRCVRILAAIVAAAGWVPAQEQEATLPPETTITRKIEESAPGSGPRIVRVGVVTSEAGAMFLISAASMDVDPMLRISSEARGLIGEDADSGGGTTAFLLAKLEAGARVVVEVVVPEGPAGTVEVRVRGIVETDETREAAARARAAIVAVKTAIAEGRNEEGRVQIEAIVEDLLETEGWRKSREILSALDAAGLAAHRAGARAEAKRAFRAAVRIAEDLYPATHPEHLSSRINLAAVSLDDDPAAARSIYEEVLAIREKTLPAGHLDLLKTRANLAEACVGLGDFATARELHARALAGIAGTRPDQDPVVIQERLTLGRTERALGNLAAAKALSEKAYADACAALPEDHELRLFATNEVAENRSAARDFKGAVELQRQILAARLRKLQEDDLEVQFARGSLAGSLRELGELEEARSLIEQVHREFSRQLPQDHLQLVTTRSNLALVLRSLGDYAAARELQEAVHDTLAGRYPEEHPDLLRVRRNLADTLMDLGDFAGALRLRRQVLEVLAKTREGTDPSLQMARSDVARVLTDLHELDAAQDLLETAEHNLRGNPAAFPFQHLGVKLDIAHVHHRRGDPAIARRMQEEILAEAVAREGEDGIHAQIIRQNLALALSQLGDHLGARRLQEAVLAARLRALGPVDAEVQSARLGLATTLCNLGDADAAHDLLVAAVDVCSRTLPESSDLLQKARANLAATFRARGDQESARTLLTRALEAQVQSLGDGHPTVQITRGNLAGVLEELGRFEEAAGFHEKALEGRRASLGENHPETQLGFINLGGCLRRMGQVSDARPLLAGAVAALAESRPDTDHLVQTGRSELAWTHVVEEAWEPAAAEAGRLAAGLRLRLLTHAAGLSPREVSALADDLGPLVSSTLSLSAVPELAAADPDLGGQIFTLVESLRGSALSAWAAARAGLPPESRAAEAEGRRKISELTARSADLAQRGDVEGTLAALREKEKIQRDLVLLMPGRSGAGALDGTRIAARLAGDEAVVGFWRYTRTMTEAAADGRMADVPSFLAFVLRGGKSLRRIELGSAAAVEDAVAFFRDAVLAPDGPDPAAAAAIEERAGAGVRSLLWDPLAEALKGCRRVSLLPDDVVHLVPIGALPAGDGCVVGDIFSLSVHGALDIPQPAPAGGGRLVALGGVDYDADPAALVAAAGTPRASGAGASVLVLRSGPEGVAFPPLPGSAAEALEIIDHFTEAFPDHAKSAHLAGAAASREALMALAPEARFLHLATHAWISGARSSAVADSRPVDAVSGAGVFPSAQSRMRGLAPMLLTGLALSGANRPPDATGCVGGALTAEEIAGLDLRNCELAVLSACETGVAVRRAGRGLASLQRALHAAGARQAVSSLWKVPDAPTRTLMSAFYRFLWRDGLDPAAALEAAKNLLRREKDGQGRPLHRRRAWAGWVLTTSGP